MHLFFGGGFFVREKRENRFLAYFWAK